ncbi:MAG: hypothetical protein BGP14_24035 [Sphingobacteriales bacterium 44-15]|nr:MAG: hypothetical protein BGP14_24035 [Sphingobacteriales bacterium 44-15]
MTFSSVMFFEVIEAIFDLTIKKYIPLHGDDGIWISLRTSIKNCIFFAVTFYRKTYERIAQIVQSRIRLDTQNTPIAR